MDRNAAQQEQLARAWGPTLAEGTSRTALNKYNVPEVLGLLFQALKVAGLDDTAAKLKQMGVTRLINEAWQNRGGANA